MPLTPQMGQQQMMFSPPNLPFMQHPYPCAPPSHPYGQFHHPSYLQSPHPFVLQSTIPSSVQYPYMHMFAPQQATNYYPGQGLTSPNMLYPPFQQPNMPVQHQMYGSMNVQNNIIPQPAGNERNLQAQLLILQQQNQALQLQIQNQKD